MRLRVLGTLELVGSDGSSAPAGSAVLSPRLRRLLAALVLRANGVVSVDSLADVVWGESPPANAEASMHNLISRLRTAIAAAGGGPVLLTRAPGYLLQLDPAHLDSTRFSELAAAGHGALGEDPRAAAELIDEALSLWRGAAYAEYADEDFARADAARLEAVRASATEDRVDAALALGASDEAIGRLEPLLAAHPLRERPHAQMMRALYRTGRAADALAVYRTFRERMDGELGLEPSADLQRLETQILRQDPALLPDPDGAARRVRAVAAAVPAVAPAAPASPASASGPPPAPGNLPAALPALLGRDELARSLGKALAATRVLTLTGAGGIGKTSLALRVAADAAPRFPDGVWVVELASVLDPAAVVAAVSTVLSVQHREGASLAERLEQFLRPKRLLLVLDNCEHVIEPAARLVDHLLRDCPGVRVLATSREPLGVDEQLHPVPPLPVPAVADTTLEGVRAAPAVALFLERAAAVSPGFEMNEANAPGIAEICRRLDGLPLAIELAAARMRSMTPAEVVDRLATRFHFLRSSRRIAAERHRTLRAVVDWSYGLLEENERRAFDRLSVFVGDFSIAGAEGVAGGGDPDVDMADVLGSLVDRSMLLATPGRDGVTRYLMLETMRAYGQERLAERGEFESARRGHAQCIVALTEEAASGIIGPACRQSADAIAGAIDDLRVAHSYCINHDIDMGLHLIAALFDYCELRMPQEVFAWAERTARAAPPGADLLPVAWTVAAAGARYGGALDRSAEFVALALEAAGPENPLRRLPLYILCEVTLFQGRLEDIQEIIAEVLHWSTLAGDDQRPAMVLLTGALARSYAGDLDGAEALLRDGKAHAERTRNPSLAAWCRYSEGEICSDVNPDLAITLLEGALVSAREVDDRFLAGVALVSLASVRSRYGDPHAALVLFGEVIRHWHEVGNWTQQWITMRNVIDLLTRVGDYEAATLLLGATANRTTAGPLFGPDAERLGQTEQHLGERLGPDLVAVLRARGAAMSDDDVVSWARTALDRAAVGLPAGPASPPGNGSRAGPLT